MRQRQRLPLWSPARPAFRRRARAPAVKGLMANVIVVKSPDPRFREVLFVLREDGPADQERERRELLRQAREAAGEYLRTQLPERRRSPALPLLALVGGALIAALCLLIAL